MADTSKTSIRFDTDLRARLDRLYTSAGSTNLDRAQMAMPSARRSQSSKALEEALAELRNRRERAQDALRVQEEIDLLRHQIDLLRSLNDEIARLRQQLAARQNAG